MSNYELYNKKTIAIKDFSSNEEKELFIIDNEYDLPISSKGKIEIIDKELSIKTKLKEGDIIYFDTRGCSVIKELGLTIINEENILMKENEN